MDLLNVIDMINVVFPEELKYIIVGYLSFRICSLVDKKSRHNYFKKYMIKFDPTKKIKKPEDHAEFIEKYGVSLENFDIGFEYYPDYIVEKISRVVINPFSILYDIITTFPSISKIDGLICATENNLKVLQKCQKNKINTDGVMIFVFNKEELDRYRKYVGNNPLLVGPYNDCSPTLLEGLEKNIYSIRYRSIKNTVSYDNLLYIRMNGAEIDLLLDHSKMPKLRQVNILNYMTPDKIDILVDIYPGIKIVMEHGYNSWKYEEYISFADRHIYFDICQYDNVEKLLRYEEKKSRRYGNKNITKTLIIGSSTKIEEKIMTKLYNHFIIIYE